ncbi:hypothetical protein, partial [Mycobacterium sp. E136]|uniref:hypothetical protein n=1 Tax=Mycobacterium sp. E136 TaxID=1834125 RepID=UPI000A8914B6
MTATAGIGKTIGSFADVPLHGDKRAEAPTEEAVTAHVEAAAAAHGYGADVDGFDVYALRRHPVHLI